MFSHPFSHPFIRVFTHLDKFHLPVREEHYQVGNSFLEFQVLIPDDPQNDHECVNCGSVGIPASFDCCPICGYSLREIEQCELYNQLMIAKPYPVRSYWQRYNDRGFVQFCNQRYEV